MKMVLFLILTMTINFSFATDLSVLTGDYALSNGTSNCPSTFTCAFDPFSKNYHCYDLGTDLDDNKILIDVSIYPERINNGEFNTSSAGSIETTNTTLEDNIITVIQTGRECFDEACNFPIRFLGYIQKQTLTLSLEKIEFTYRRKLKKAECTYTKI